MTGDFWCVHSDGLYTDTGIPAAGSNRFTFVKNNFFSWLFKIIGNKCGILVLHIYISIQKHNNSRTCFIANDKSILKGLVKHNKDVIHSK